MKIILTGATGYIGQKLAFKLASGGCEVHALVRKIPEHRPPENLTYHLVNLDKPKEYLDLLEGAYACFHLAAFARTWSREPEQFFHINVGITEELLKACKTAGIKRFIFTSSCATFGVSGESPITEDDPRMCDFFTLYESSKSIAEKRVLNYNMSGMECCILHPTKVYGPGVMTSSNAVTGLIKSYINGKWRLIPGNGRVRINLSYIDDVVDGHVQAMLHGKPGNQYLLGGINTDYNDLFTLIREISGKNHTLYKIPTFAMNMYGLHQEFRAFVMNKPPLITRKWIYKFNQDLAVDSSKAVEELGYNITPLESGIKQTIDWLNDSYDTHTL